ncbi:MAG: CBS domain-containing protein [Chloroflexota bacterium]|nr:CBS domain-containing protein [Chloroflexota bacterium]MDE2840973.1 CBS domain-containing protein [Chloroflexota bacterium]MDE2929726.1 CBS domain-containing protein [Chloroflexota bacterium]
MTESNTIRVRDLMVSDLHTIDGLATVAEAMAMMKRQQVSSLVVDRRNEDDELGLVVVADIARGVIADNRAPERVNVYEIMSKPLLTLPEEMLARYAVRILVRFELSRAVVVDQHRNAIGIVTLRDLIMAYAAE